MKNVTRKTKSIVGVIATIAVLMVLVVPRFNVSTYAAIESTDYFQLTAAGSATTMDAGASLVFTLNAKDGSDSANTLAGADYAFVEIMSSGTWSETIDADVTAVAGGLALKASVTTPWGATTAANLSGTNDRLVAVNVDATGTGTFTVVAGESFNLCVWAEGAAVNMPDAGEWNDAGTPSGQDCREITVTAVAGTPDHLVASSTPTSAEVAEEITYTITQVNAGGGTDITALADVGVSVGVNGTGAATITKVNGVDVETPADSVSNMTLTAGVGTVTVVVSTLGDGNGTVTVTPSSAVTLAAGNGSAVADATVTAGAATDLTVQGYGPPTGQIGVPTNAPIDFFFSKNPDTAGTVFTNDSLTNAVDSAFSITTGGSAVTGEWHVFSESWGADTFYGVTFDSTAPFADSTSYTFSVLKSLAVSKGSTDLVDGGAAWTATVTTGTGGGTYNDDDWVDGTYTGDMDMGGEFPPMAMMGYPMPGEWEVPTNIGCVVVDFDRPMDATNLTTGNIYLKKVTNGVLSTPSGTPTVTSLNTDNDSVCIAGNTLEANSEYCVVVARDVTDTSGGQLAGMPGSSAEGCGGSFGFGFDNMGPFEESFHTGSGTETVTATLMGLNIGVVGSTITGTSVGSIMRASFDNPLNPSTVNATNVTLKKNGTVPVPGTVYYDSMSNAIEFVPNAVLSANTSYTFAISSSVTSISGTAISSTSQTFTTGAADSTDPKVVFAEADDFGFSVQFDEPVTTTTVENKNYYTFKTCSQQTVTNSTTCADSSTPTTVSLMSGVTAHYERLEDSVWMDGLNLTPGDGFYVEIATGVTDVTGNGVDAGNKSWTGFVMNGGNFDGGQGMFSMDSMGFEDFDMKDMGMMPVGVWPMNSMGGISTVYFIDIPLSTAIPADGYIELTFPAGFDVSGAIQDAYSPMNSDFNGPGTGTPTFKGGVTSSVSTDTASSGAGTLDNGIGYIAGARKVYIQLDSTTQATDFLHIDLDGITNATEARDWDTAGYQVEMKTYSNAGILLEGMTSMPFYITSAGTNTISGTISSGGSGVNDARVFLDSWAAGSQETTTANDGAGTLVAGSNDGEYKFENLPDGDYNIFIEPSNGYSGEDYSLGYISSATTKNITLTTQNGTNCATLPVSVNFTSIGSVDNIGLDDSLDIFGWNTTGMGGFVHTLTRAQVINSASTPVDVFLCGTGMYNIGIGPSIPKGDFATFPVMEWMTPSDQSVNVVTANIGGADLSTATFTVAEADATITGIVKDSSGTAVSNSHVFADFPEGGFAGDANAGADGIFSIPVTSGKVYRVGAFAPGMPSGSTSSVRVDSSGNVYVNGSATASTGSSGGSPFTLTMTLNIANSVTVTGSVSDGTNPIEGAGVWAFRTDATSPPVDAFTDSSGLYTIYIPESGTWQVEANAPGKGHLGTKTLTIAGENVTGQNFEPLADNLLGTISGTIDVPGTNDDSGVVVMAYNPDGFFNSAVTEEDGTYSFDVPIDADAYTMEAWHPAVGDLMKVSQVVDGNETVTPDVLGTPRTFTVTLNEAVSDEVTLNLTSSTGMGTDVVIPAGETVITTALPEGNYYLEDLDTPFDETNVVVAGAEINNVDGTPTTNDILDIDNTGDDITITFPTLNTVSGTVSDTDGTVEDVVVTVIDESTLDTFTVLTDSSGDYTFEVPDGTYSVLTEQSSYVATPQTMTVAADLPSQDFALDIADKTIQGTITDSGGSPVEGAFVYAQMAGGGLATAETATDGTYTMNVSDGQWDVQAITDGYAASEALVVDASTTNVTSADVQLPATTVTLNDPATAPITSNSPTSFSDPDMDIDFVLPSDSVDADATMTFTETNELPTTSSADPFATGIDINATTTNDSTPITSFDNDAELTFDYTLADLVTEGIDTPTEVDQVNINYLNDNTNNWTPISTTVTYYDSAGAVIPGPTVEAYASLAAASTGADLTTLELSADIDHLTTFAPVVSSGATPPATPTGLSAAAGDGRVTLTWTANSEGDMSSYNIWEGNVTAGILTTILHSTCSGTCSATVGGANGTLYSYQIAAVDTDSDRSAYTSAVTSTPVAGAVTGGGSPIIIGGGGGGGGGGSSDTADDEDEADEDAVEGAEAGADAAEGVSGTIGAGGGLGFIDTANHWAEKFIEDLYTRGVVSGYDAEHFGPENNISRAELTKIAIEAFEISLSDEEGGEFSDVSESEWYAPYVRTAYLANIVGGYSDGTFGPNKKVSRSEALRILFDAAGVDVETDYDAGFPDVSANAWYVSYVNYAAENGIVSGYGDGTFGPNEKLTRAQVSKIVSLMIDMYVDNVGGLVEEILEMAN
ncbi:MAG: DUF1416 domain-containing protein [Simkaniaceae bacterium]|nr:DUF1416 domain-containing protein [Simkaniaceae bacterium]